VIGAGEKSVREFRVPQERRRDTKTRLFVWSPILLLIISFGSIFVAPHRAQAFVYLASSAAVLGVVAAYAVAIREGRRRAKRRKVFALGDEEIIRRREGWPDDKIRFSEIVALYEDTKDLVVETTDPFRRMTIPKELTGYDVMRAELGKHAPIRQSKPPRVKLTWTIVVRVILAILSWGAIAIVFYYSLHRH
jgi:uncharacterized membrane protein YbhN (UPF0104 family)